MRMWQGAAGVAPIDGLVSPAYVVAKPLEGIDPRYFANLFRTFAYMSEVDKYSRGIVKDRNRLYWEDFKQMPSPCPPSSEQVQIADTIENDTQLPNTQLIVLIAKSTRYRNTARAWSPMW
jgi:type I restriction enzyme S subunit